MALAVVQSKEGSAGSGATDVDIAFDSTVSAGNNILAFSGTLSDDNPNGCSDNIEGAYGDVIAVFSSADSAVHLGCYGFADHSGGTVTVTVTFATSHGTYSSSHFAYEVSGTLASAITSPDRSNTGSVTTGADPHNVALGSAPSANGAIIFTSSCSENGLVSCASPFDANEVIGSVSIGQGVSYIVQGTAADVTASWDIGGGGPNRAVGTLIFAFVEDTGGGGTDELTADDTESDSEVSSPAVGQVHALAAADSESNSEVSEPALNESNILLAEYAESNSEVTSPDLGQVHAITADDAESNSEVSAPVLGQVHGLTAEDAESESELSAPAVNESNILLAEDIESLSELTSPVFGSTTPTYRHASKGRRLDRKAGEKSLRVRGKTREKSLRVL